MKKSVLGLAIFLLAFWGGSVSAATFVWTGKVPTKNCVYNKVTNKTPLNELQVQCGSEIEVVEKQGDVKKVVSFRL
ncbi:hypothetical protein ABRZ68_12005 [Vibrio vulnificus]|uniref:hypothetical protein n=1 Tax=Vibrio vulnificus TaxID=672 RepID=UPI001A181478|nr:hypothetical protein [Vibrio vulnificus]